MGMKNFEKGFLLLFFSFFAVIPAFAQEDTSRVEPQVEPLNPPLPENTEGDTAGTSAPMELNDPLEKPLTIDLSMQPKEEEEEIPEKKRKKNVFYDIKTKKAYAKSGFGQNEKIEIFHVLKEWENPDPYVRDIYWYEYSSKSVKVGGSPSPEKGMLLHGPYRVEKDGEILIKGIFYKGTKHGRWTSYRKMQDYLALESKEEYVKGWPKESEISYYDREATKLKEVIPVEYGKKEGNYYLFFPSGQVAVRGEFRYDKKVGTWTEYYPLRQRRKKEIQYAPDPWTDKFRPFIAQEWNQEGELIYERKKK